MAVNFFKKIQIPKKYIIAVVLIFLGIGGAMYAAYNPDCHSVLHNWDCYKAPGVISSSPSSPPEVPINEYGDNICLQNFNDLDIFVPTKSSNEWSKFKTNKPGVDIHTCPVVCIPGSLSGSDTGEPANSQGKLDSQNNAIASLNNAINATSTWNATTKANMHTVVSQITWPSTYGSTNGSATINGENYTWTATTWFTGTVDNKKSWNSSAILNKFCSDFNNCDAQYCYAGGSIHGASCYLRYTKYQPNNPPSLQCGLQICPNGLCPDIVRGQEGVGSINDPSGETDFRLVCTVAVADQNANGGAGNYWGGSYSASPNGIKNCGF